MIYIARLQWPGNPEDTKCFCIISDPASLSSYKAFLRKRQREEYHNYEVVVTEREA